MAVRIDKAQGGEGAPVGSFIRSPGWTVLGGAALLAAALAILIAWWLGREAAPEAAAPASADIASAPPGEAGRPAPPAGDVRALPEAEQLAHAFRAAFGRADSATIAVEGGRLTYRPARLLWLDDRAVLISAGASDQSCHACAGGLAVHYLRPAGDRFEVAGSWPAAVTGWGWGEPPLKWSVTSRLTRYPAIYAEGHYMGQGIICTSARLTELRPEGPAQSDPIWTGYSNEGALTDERLARGERVRELDGTIAAIRRDRAFEVRFTGTDRFTELYVRRGDRFVAAAPTRLDC